MEITPAKTLVLFDFDGTLTKGDTLSRFLLYSLSPGALVRGTMLVIYSFLRMIWQGSWTSARGKEELMSVFFKGCEKPQLEQLGAAFCREKLPDLLRLEVLEQLRAYQKAGARTAVVSASADIWIKSFSEAEGIDLVCTQLEYLDGVFTGKFATPNCNGHEKAVRIRAAFNLADYAKVIAFGNSVGDSDMFALSDEAWLIHGRGKQIQVVYP
jgi:HAD superfamily hydrolase (TIGR01490 family)